MTNNNLHVPPGHYYSPIPSLADINVANETRNKKNLLGVDLFPQEQFKIAQHFAELYPEVINWLSFETTKYTLDNSWFFGSDAITLCLMVLTSKPKTIIEIGSGYSTALIEDINKQWFEEQIDFQTVDPNIERVKELKLNVKTLECPVQQLDLSFFSTLNSGDLLLIDSSHVLKAGSDVHFILSQVVPSLKSGVKIHIHDVFYPFEYPSFWLEDKISFNEAYAVELLLQNSNKIRVFYWNDFIENTNKDWFKSNMPQCLVSKHKTGGIWLEIL